MRVADLRWRSSPGGPCRYIGRERLGSALLLLMLSALAQAANTEPNSAGQAPLQEVVVTAEFLKESAQQVPLAISAVDAATLGRRAQSRLTDIMRDVPSVELYETAAAFGPSMGAYIRGIGQYDFDPALEPGVGLYIDDVYFATLTGSLLDLLDTERVEVLRGPQGTLDGMNAEGGAIKIFSRLPDSRESTTLDALYGSRNHLELRASTQFPLTDHLFARVSGVENHQDGYEHVYDFGCANPAFAATPVTFGVGGEPIYGTPGTYSIAPAYLTSPGSCRLGREGGTDYSAGLLALRWSVNPDLDVTATGDLTDEDEEVPAETLIYGGPGPLEGNASAMNAALVTIPTTSGVQIPYDASKVPALVPSNPYSTYATFCMPAVSHPLAIPGLGSDFNQAAYCASPRQQLVSWGWHLTVDWKMSSGITLKNILSQRGYSSNWAEDDDESPWPVQLGQEALSHHQFSEELRLSGRWSRRLEWTLGGFYFRELSVYSGHENLWYVLPTLPGFFNFLMNDPVLAHDKAGYLQVVTHATRSFDVTLGARYTSQDKTYRYVRLNPQGGTGGSATLLGGLNGLAASYSASRPDWRANLSYRFTDRMLGYVQYATGFKGGGIDPRPFNAEQVVHFGPENLTTYELGVKSLWLDSRVQLDLDGYFSQYRDIQLILGDCNGVAGIEPPFGIPCALPYNAGSAHQKGVELEIRGRFGGFEIDGAASYLAFDYVTVNPSTGITPGMVTPWTPKWQAEAGAQYTWRMRRGALTARVDGFSRSKVYTAGVNGPYNRIGGYTSCDAHLIWDTAERNWQVMAHVKNLTGKRYWIDVFDLVQVGGGSEIGVPSAPVEVDLELKHAL
jgi:iron complex outermembrane recepter protein